MFNMNLFSMFLNIWSRAVLLFTAFILDPMTTDLNVFHLRCFMPFDNDDSISDDVWDSEILQKWSRTRLSLGRTVLRRQQLPSWVDSGNSSLSPLSMTLYPSSPLSPLFPSFPPSTWWSPGRHWEAAKGLPHPELEETIRLHILFQVEDHDDDDNSDDNDNYLQEPNICAAFAETGKKSFQDFCI